MKRLALIGMLALAQSAVASVASPCSEPEYLQLKTASKSELREEYCIATRRAQSEDRMHQIVQDGIAQKRAIPVDTSENEKESMEYLKSAGSCRVRAAKFQVALSKRFKSKPPASCD
jgi:hypothetical protein